MNLQPAKKKSHDRNLRYLLNIIDFIRRTGVYPMLLGNKQLNLSSLIDMRSVHRD